MHVSVLSPDLSRNCLGRAYVIANLLERNHDVEIVGPKLGDGVWKPMRNEYDYRGVDTSPRPHRFLRAIPELLDAASGDIIYASKPRLESYGVALLDRFSTDRPIILDIDDWESGFGYRDSHPVFSYIKGLPKLIHTNSFYYKRACEVLADKADARTVSNYFLQDRFGGVIIQHARDTERFYPDKFDKNRAREELNLPQEKFLVMFFGTPHPYKGVEDLIRAIVEIDREDVLGVIVGASDSPFSHRVRRIAPESVRVKGMQPFDEIPKWIAAADLIAIPQRDTAATRGQLPAKIFDAMAMGKPVVTTDIGDLPRVLGKGGKIVPPSSPVVLSEAILHFAFDEEQRRKMGRIARGRCERLYSYDALAPKIDDVISSLEV